MNLTDIKPTQTANQFANSMQNTFGVTVDISKLDLDKSAKLLISVNEQIQKQRLSEDRHKLHTTKSYLAKIFIKENLEKHIAELTEYQETPPWMRGDQSTGDTDSQTIRRRKKRKEHPELNWPEPGKPDKNAGIPGFPGGRNWQGDDEANFPTRRKAKKVRQEPEESLNSRIDKLKSKLNEFGAEDTAAADKDLDKVSKKGMYRKEPAKPALDKAAKMLKNDVNEEKGFTFDPKGFVALRKLVGSENMMRAKRAIEMAHDGRAVPAMFVKSFLPLIDMLDDIMMSGMANVQMLNNLTKRARKQLGIEESKEQVSERLRGLYESQEDQAELLLASKDVVDRVQKAVDDLSKLRNEDLPPLLDAMRDEVGSEISTAYSNIVVPTLDQLVDANQMARETLSQASRILTGEEQAPQAMGAEAPVEEVPAEVPAEEFETADVAAGAEEEIGRAERQ